MQRMARAVQEVENTLRQAAYGLPRLQFRKQMRQGNGPYFFRHVERMFSCMDDKETLKFQVGQGNSHRGRDGWSRTPLDFKAPTFSSANNHQVEFGSGVSPPKKALVRQYVQKRGDLRDDESFPGSSKFWIVFLRWRGFDGQSNCLFSGEATRPLSKKYRCLFSSVPIGTTIG